MKIAGARVLIVEDDAVMRTFVESSLRRMGIHSIETCVDGISALTTMVKFKPDLILTDVHMQPMGGLEFVKKLRGASSTIFKNTKVIFMSADASAETIGEALPLGIVGYIVKPPRLEALKAKLEQVFFYSWLRSKFGARIYYNNRQLHGAPLLLVNQSDVPMEPHLWLTAWLISSADCPVEIFDWPVPVGELALAVEYLQPRGVLLYSSKSLNLPLLPRLLANIACPKLISGPTVRIHFDELSVCTTEIDGLTLAEDPLTAQAELQRLGLI